MSNQTTFSQALLNPEQPCPDGLRSWNGSDPAQRFAIYRNNVTRSLIDALADTFPVVAELVGAEFFELLAHSYIQHSPPTSRLLVEYGETFADFIQGFAPASSVPYLADVARLEFARVRAYHSADITALTPVAIAEVIGQPEHLASMTFALHPSVQIVHSRFAHVSIWAAHQGTHDLAGVDSQCAETALILRNRLSVEVMAIQPADAAFISALLDGQPLAKAAELAMDVVAEFNLSPPLAHLINTAVIVGYAYPGASLGNNHV